MQRGINMLNEDLHRAVKAGVWYGMASHGPAESQPARLAVKSRELCTKGNRSPGSQ
jgi:hypothetical protein